MYERLTMVVFAYPGAVMAAGSGLISFAGLFAVIGLRVGRLGRRLARVFERYGVEPPDLMSGFPWLLRPLIPETALGWIGVTTFTASGSYHLHGQGMQSCRRKKSPQMAGYQASSHHFFFFLRAGFLMS